MLRQQKFMFSPVFACLVKHREDCEPKVLSQWGTRGEREKRRGIGNKRCNSVFWGPFCLQETRHCNCEWNLLSQRYRPRELFGYFQQGIEIWRPHFVQCLPSIIQKDVMWAPQVIKKMWADFLHCLIKIEKGRLVLNWKRVFHQMLAGNC